MRPLANLGSLCAPFVPSAGTPFPFTAGVGGGGIDCVATLILQREAGRGGYEQKNDGGLSRARSKVRILRPR